MAFIILGLPRSRTLWLSKFLTYGDWVCGHDELQYMRSLDDVKTWWTQPNIGTCETAAAPFWRLLPENIKVVTVRRPVWDVLNSVMRIIPHVDRAAMHSVLRTMDRKLDQVEARIPGVERFSYYDLWQRDQCARLFKHCLPYPFDEDWWRSRDKQKISGDLPTQVRYCQAYAKQLAKLAGAAKQATLIKLHSKKRPPSDGFTFQEESFDSWLVDAQKLFRHHLAATDQDSEGWGLKNIPLGRQLDAAGMLQVTTARQNGRMFGYVLSLISPSADEQDVWVAQNMLPYASPEAPGIGRRLQMAAIDLLEEKGISEVVGRTGIVGDGPRLDAMYKRLGFKPMGQLYSLKIKDRTWASQ